MDEHVQPATTGIGKQEVKGKRSKLFFREPNRHELRST